MTDRPSRFPPLAPAAMTPDQRRVADGIVSGPRGGLRGPFQAWLRSPELAERLQKVGEYLRFNSSVPRRLLRPGKLPSRAAPRRLRATWQLLNPRVDTRP